MEECLGNHIIWSGTILLTVLRRYIRAKCVENHSLVLIMFFDMLNYATNRCEFYIKSRMRESWIWYFLAIQSTHCVKPSRTSLIVPFLNSRRQKTSSAGCKDSNLSYKNENKLLKLLQLSINLADNVLYNIAEVKRSINWDVCKIAIKMNLFN